MWHKYGRFLKIWFLYACLTILITWPVAAQLGSHIPGKIGDAYEHLWIFVWLKQTILSGQNPYFTDLLFYPVGVNLLNHNIAWVNFIIWLPLQAIFGEAAGYSLSFLFIFPLNGIATFLFLRDLKMSEKAAFLGGLTAAFWPYLLSHHGHPNLILIAWIPLSLLFLRRWQKEKRWQNAVFAGVFIALIGLTRWQLLIMATPLLGIYWLFLVVTNKIKFQKVVAHSILTGAVAFLLMAPLLMPILTYQLARENPDELLINENPYPTDLAAYVTPGSYHPVWGNSVEPLTRGFVGNNIYVRFWGYTALLLAIFGIVTQLKRAWFWLLVFIIYVLLALGPVLYVAGTATIPLPFQFLADSFVMQNLRFPDRFNVITVIPFALLVALGSASLLSRRPFKKSPLICTIIISFLLLGEYINHYETMPLRTPAWYSSLSTQSDTFAIVDIPFDEEPINKQYMLYQVKHQLPTVNGRVSRTPPEALSYIHDVPLLSLMLSSKVPSAEIQNVAYQLNLLKTQNVRYIVLHRQFLSPEEENAWRAWLVRPPLHQDEDVLIFSTEPFTVGQEINIDEYAAVAPEYGEFGLYEATFNSIIGQGSWLGLKAVWAAATPIGADLTACYTLQHHQTGQKQESCHPVASTWPSSMWAENEVVHTYDQIQIDPFAQPGAYQLELNLFDQDTLITTQPFILGNIQVEALDREFSATIPANGQTAVWQNLLQLHGYELNQTETELAITLHWQALARPDQSYKFFVHLVNTATGELAAQADYVPRDWTYPTNWWEAEEYVVDTAVLSLENVTSGTYQLLIGIYDPETGLRLQATTDDSSFVDVIKLTEITR
ncbi:MAG: hypothetical protein DHS20C20_06770 [Ardenticatenaceae bacterium]|nr:MAG: hypothetical protein DHS20C20_06770 [Ardenticatenaceae bacterium]